MIDNNKQNFIPNRSIERGLELLKLFEETNRGLTFTEIRQGIQLPKATTYRILNTLMMMGFVDYTESTKLYTLGPEIMKLGLRAMQSRDLLSAAHPVMEQLQLLTKQSVALYVRRNNTKVCLSKIEPKDSVHYIPDVGCPLSIWRGASGVVLLSGLEESAIDSILESAREEILRSDIGVDCDELKRRILQAKRDGYFFSTLGYGYDVYNIAVPVRSYEGRIVATLNIAGKAKSFTEDKIEEWIPLLRQAADKVSFKAGY